MSAVLEYRTTIKTATFDSDSVFPNTDYGKEIGVVIALNEPSEPDSLTIRIDGENYILSEIEYLIEQAKKVRNAAVAFKK